MRGTLEVRRLRGFAGSDFSKFAVSVLPTGLGAVLQFAVFALTARALGPDLFGRLAVIYGVAAIAVEVAGLGSDEVIVRRAAARATAYGQAAGHALAVNAWVLAPVVLVATALAAALVPEVPAWAVGALVLADVVLQRAIAFAEKSMVAHHQAVRASFVRLAGTGARALVAVLVFWGLARADIPAWALGSVVQSALVGAALIWLAMRLYGAPRWGVLREELGFGAMFMVTHLARALQGNLDRVLLAPVLAASLMGVYAAATRLLIIGTVLLQAALRIYYPRFFVAAEEGAGALKAHTIKTAKVLAGVGVLAAAGIAVAGQLLPLLLGEAYGEVARLTPVIALAMPFMALQYPAGDALTAAGEQRLRMLVGLIGAVVFSLGLLGGAMAGGLMGAAVMYAVGHALLAAAYWATALRVLR